MSDALRERAIEMYVPGIVTFQDVADALGTSVTTVQRWVRAQLHLDPNCAMCGRRVPTSYLRVHEGSCGRGLSRRFKIHAVAGYAIGDGHRTNNTYGCTYTIMDSHRCYEPVANFSNGKNMSVERARARAEKMCRELNGEERQAELAEAIA